MKKFILTGLLAISSIAVWPEAQSVPVYCDCKGIGTPNPEGGPGQNLGNVKPTGGNKMGLTNDNSPIIKLLVQFEMWRLLMRL